MLIKLIKYDLRSLNRFLIILHGFLLLMTIFLRIFITGQIHLSTDTDGFLFGLAIVMYTLLITGITFGTSIVIVVRFYRNLFSDEGYLSQTLPVTPGQHLLAKTISGSIWAMIDYVFILASLYIGIATPAFMELFYENQGELMKELGFTGKYADVTAGQIILVLLISGFIGCVGNIVMYYASIVLGQLFSSHRVIGAVACYFALSTLMAVISFIVMFAADLAYGNFAIVPAGTENSLSLVEYMVRILTFSLALSVITAVVLYIPSYILMKKKLDLN